ncbi:hypothetical protein SARC_09026 [Sphaeroforma arctica JP610]|uniref:Fungal lipase-type domain-containing protein n=1 Tax=Sphaeroforma arctica JP610 TaxID=667725 RepID=A0A0L0FRD1_9EUKA|nr:hypothetical protein SARC_09026 [Sphaeroforma arctica JP610]KNC78553.1 hypothetical protein SARC_09026 [Sphaeroforma arctica JP610]|eukprot:XP_014152455.1 hypothetical protein SARC_09026 [Sphaeroforma arctica JP610]
MFIGVVLPCLALKYISVSALPWITVARQEFRVGMYADHIDGKVCNTRRALSLVNATTPRLYADYLRLVSVGSAALRDLKYNLAGVENVQTLNKPNHNLANFLCHLNAASYEDDIVLSTFIFKLRELFNDDLEFHRFGHDRGMVLVVWSVISNFVCISFKGSSPLHLAQYVMNTGTQKRFSATGMFRGGVHTTAYDALQLPNTSYNKTQAEMPRGIYTGEEPQQVPLVYAISNFITDVVLPSFEPRSDRAPKPQLWISGFGLGGATASLFTATILHTSRDELGLHHTTPSLNWDDIFTLRGTYTFGAPPVGDEEFRRCVV